VRAECPDLVVRQRAQCRDVGGGGPAPDGADTDDPDTQLRFKGPLHGAGSGAGVRVFIQDDLALRAVD